VLTCRAGDSGVVAAGQDGGTRPGERSDAATGAGGVARWRRPPEGEDVILVSTSAFDITDRTPEGIAAAVGRQIRSGTIPPGTRLPTVRELSKDLGVSTATVTRAWSALAAVGAIQARGRAGTIVLAQPVADRWAGEPSMAGPINERSHRMRDVGTLGPANFRIDLSSGTPDRSLLPVCRLQMENVNQRVPPSSYFAPPVLADLETLLLRDFPFEPDSLTVLDGAMDAIDRLGRELVRLGDTVIVEDPVWPPILDLFHRLGAVPIGVPTDEFGIRPDDLNSTLQSLSEMPVAIVLQPRCQNPTGASMTLRRAQHLSEVVHRFDRRRRIVIIEDDHSGAISQAPPVSMGRFLPDRTVLVRSFSKSHGPELRIAAVGGPAGLINAVVERRLLGPGWTSRVLQHMLLDLLTDPAAGESVALAAQIYHHRRTMFAAALARHGVPTSPGDGINTWVPVENEQAALITLAAAGIRVAPGSPFHQHDDPPDHIRVTTSTLTEDVIEEVAGAIATAAFATTGYRSRRTGHRRRAT
jgi:DNA-binding transcriptional MocR family regulator